VATRSVPTRFQHFADESSSTGGSGGGAIQIAADVDPIKACYVVVLFYRCCSDFRCGVGGVVSGLYFTNTCPKSPCGAPFSSRLLVAASFIHFICPALRNPRGFLVLTSIRKSPPANNLEKYCHFMWQRASTCWISALVEGFVNVDELQQQALLRAVGRIISRSITKVAAP
jgi:hypothetical protein